MAKPTRRKLLQSLAALALPACVPPPQTLEPEPRRVRVGAHIWVYAADRPRHDVSGILGQIFSDMAYAGIEFLEVMHTTLEPPGAVDRILELSDKHGVPVIGASYSAPMWDATRHEEIFEYADRLFDKLRRLGAELVGVSAGDAGRKKTEAELDAQADILRRIRYRASVNGIRLVLHNHTYEIRDDEYDLRGTLQRIPDLQLGPDIGWLAAAGVDPADFLRRYAERIVYAHLRDRKSDGSWAEALGEGDIDYRAVSDALKEIQFSGDLAIELAHSPGFRPTRPLRESFKISRDYVRKTMGH